MVNKSSFFQRLKERWGSGSGVRVKPATPAASRGGVDPRTAAGLGTPARSKSEAASAKPAEKVEKPIEKAERTERAERAERAEKPVVVPAPAPAPTIQRVEAERQPAPNPVRELSSEFAAIETKSTRKLSDREEAMLAVGSHFQELTSVLRASQMRQDEQLGKLIDAATSLTNLPALSQQQLAVLQGLSSHMERQHELGERIASTLTTLPSLLQNVETALARAAATDERTAATVREFQSTMDRIHESMGRMVEHSDQQAKAAASLAAHRDEELQQLGKGLQASQEAQARVAADLRRTTDEGLQSLRRSNEDQSNRLQKAVAENARWNRLLLAGIAVVAVGVVALVVVLLVR